MKQERIEAYEKIRKAPTEAPLLLIPYWNIPFELYIDACGYGLGAVLHQVQIIDGKPTDGPICYIARQIKPTEARCSAYVWWALANTPDNPAYLPLEAKPQIPIERSNITDIGTEFCEEVRESYKKDRNCHTLNSLLDKD
ncbi:hypothetical protein O181_066905 [Austropuccinia psidii MF-1]|uniref:Reverse transcriptase/retrotransposon-derived protein RNase H-like domain-containing protein n=1 Tax=Austropuccinia psidii MF-1 TaxID=1389203 RepID=A0A9Q3EPU1_9BASI|nr:hypothetical protein [Austropuccinia psidii MF-1]